MTQDFEGDLTESVFWGADLSRARFRDVNLTGVAMKGVWLVDVDIDGLVDRLTINGVDVTDYVNAHDPWQPLRGMLRPQDLAGMQATWAALEREWAIDKWFTVPLAGSDFHAIGMPNTGSASLPWEGIDPDSDPTYEEVLAVRADRSRRFAAHLAALTDDDLERDVDVLENGTVPLRECVYTVFEEEFEHRRYALRDLVRTR